jgi:hypothetical protein
MQTQAHSQALVSGVGPYTDDWAYRPPPATRPNAGLFSGAGSASGPGAPWAAVPVTPDAGTMTRETLLSANPPPGATDQFDHAAFRPGNSRPLIAGLRPVPDLAVVCAPQSPAVVRPPPTACDVTFGTRQYAAW